MRLILALCLLLPSFAVSAADCTEGDPRVYEIVHAYVQRAPLQKLAEIPDQATARCLADRVVEALHVDAGWGPPVGYKVGLTSKAMQERLGLDAPLWGQLLKAMLLPNGETVPVNFGARTIVEADLLVTVADDAINEATTTAEAAKHLSKVTAFIELPDLLFAKDQPLTAERIVAINVGGRLGVVGESVAMSPEVAAALPAMTVEMTANGKTERSATGAALMGDPLEALLWLIASLKAEGLSLKAGDVVSLGGFGAPLPPRAGETVTVTYGGLPGGPLSVSLTFTDE